MSPLFWFGPPKELDADINLIAPEAKYDASLTLYLALFQREEQVASER